MTDDKEIKWKIQISTTIQVPKEITFKTIIGAISLTEAFNEATKRSLEMGHKDGRIYFVSGIDRA